MLITKEFAAKGTAMLGSVGAGGTGLYYGGHYLNGLSKNGTALKSYMGEKEDNYVKFTVKRGDKSADSSIYYENQYHGFNVDFTDKQPFTVVATASKLKNTRVSNSQGGTQDIDTNAAISCSFKFEVEGDIGTTTTIKDNY